MSEETEETQQQQTDDIVARANEAAERLEAANKQKEELLKREEALRVRESLGGTSEVQQQKKELSDAEYANMAIEGKLRFQDEK